MDIYTQTYELPGDVKGVLVEKPDDCYIIIINSLLSEEERVKTYLHEVKHLRQRDFEKGCADEIERGMK